jgi:hypothetical protein
MLTIAHSAISGSLIISASPISLVSCQENGCLQLSRVRSTSSQLGRAFGTGISAKRVVACFCRSPPATGISVCTINWRAQSLARVTTQNPSQERVPRNCANEPVPFAINSSLISGLQNDHVPSGSCQQRPSRLRRRNSV